MNALALVLSAALAAVPPLTDEQRARLAAADDGLAARDDAFETLIEHVGSWTPGLGDTPIRLDPDLYRMLDEPAAWRGELCRLRGRIELVSPLAAPHEGVVEWFIRDDAGRPILLYVCGLPPEHGFGPGVRVAIAARFYKRVHETARDGRLRRYPAFVGAFPVVAGDSWGQVWVVVAPVALMLAVFLLLFVWARRGGRSGRVRLRQATPPLDDGGPPLPEDAAAALEELERRAEGSEP